MVQEWDRVAGDYSAMMGERGDWLHRHLIGPYVAERVEAGDQVLDLGCGEGWLARFLAERGCELTGVDASAELLLEAERKETSATLMHADASKPLKLSGRSFDVVVATMVLHCTDRFEGVLENAWNVLRPDGELVVIIPHPAFAPPAARWAKTVWGKLFRIAPFKRVDRYAPAFRRKYVIDGLSQPVMIYHRPLSVYIQAALDRGFTLEHITELVPTAQDLKTAQQPLWRTRFPQLLAMTFSK